MHARHSIHIDDRHETTVVSFTGEVPRKGDRVRFKYDGQWWLGPVGLVEWSVVNGVSTARVYLEEVEAV